MKIPAAFVATLFLMVFSFLPAQENQTERIESFYSVITVNPDSTMDVTEYIRVFAVGDKIKRGIYRDFPTKYKNNMGFIYYVGFDVKSVKRDGVDENYFTQDIDNGVRVYFGSEDYYLPNYTSYLYELKYKTDRQLYFTSNYTELYWNVTGNDWDFEIERATAEIVLPDGAGKKAFFIEAYTGPQGSKDTNYVMTREKNKITIYSGARLEPGEGLTVLVRFPSGYVTEPVKQSRWNELIRYNKGEFIGIGGLLLVLLYYIIAWLIAGRDPKKGTIMPTFEAPDGLSPAAMRFIMKMGYDNEAFASALVDMAVKGYLKITEKDGEYTVDRTGNKAENISADEKRIAETIFDEKDTFKFKRTNHTKVAEAIAALKKSLSDNYEKNFFLKNAGYFVFGLILSFAAIVLSYVFGGGGESFFLLVWLTIWTAGCLPLVFMVIKSWGQVVRSKGATKALGAGGALFLTFFSIPFLGAEVGVSIFYLTQYSPWMMIIVISTICLNLLFYYLMKSPTSAGRAVMDKIDGFKMFLSATEKERLEKMIPMDKNMVNFEKFLPYAIALNVEQKWTGQFKEVLDAAQSAKSNPSWYSGSSWSTLGAAAFATSLGSSISGAVGSSSTSSSSGGGSGGGGGSSGGGGGGGGGGGW